MTRHAAAIFVAVVFCIPFVARAAAPQPERAIVAGPMGKLAYATDAQGNRVPDFSYCGYKAGGVPIPTAPVQIIVKPTPGDSTARIQAALDYVAGLPVGENGLRGAVLLLKGRHEIAGALRIEASGVVLRGEGFGKDGTALAATGQDRRTVITLAGKADLTIDEHAIAITDDYVPVNAMQISAANHNLKVGQSILIRRPSKAEWINALGMDRFGGDRHGGGWKPGSRDILWDRTVTAIDGDRITLDAPLTTALDRNYGGGTLAPYNWPGRINNVGVENLRIESVFDAAKPADEDHAWIAISIDHARDVWVRQVEMAHFCASAVAIYEHASRVTVEDCKSVAPISENAGARRNTFFTSGQQTLIQRCWSENGRHDFSLGICAAGPNAFVQCYASGALADSGPIDSWASGALFDNVRIEGNELNVYDRKYRAQQSGWSGANCMLWQCTAAVINCYSPPTATNWAYGCWGQFSGSGDFASSRESINPDSLYYAQLADRLGPQAKIDAQLMPTQSDASSSPTIAQANALSAASKQPAPRLDQWIDAAPQRNPISTDHAQAKDVDQIAAAAPTSAPSQHRVELKHGRLLLDGALMAGAQQEITWWNGGSRPLEIAAASSKAPNITRFIPGRNGPGATDDLNQLTDTMRATDFAALVHHYGLWYDTRSTDHERIRRANGDVWPPFYEQPFLRSGTGVAWDGLSRYDLTRYNPWYWNRLKHFADLCDQKGLLLINEHYFQHNILEAGAHWASCPWRPTNNINDTGFPEPPPYAGDKRIFLAEQFYDVTNPIRAPIYRALIRKNLDNFADNANVIHLTSDEFTGPLHFVQFWLDTIAEWEKETGKHPLIGLSATKDVQDAILADPKRAPLISVIDIRYWWYQPDGQAYAPPGGQNLAPRQFERILKPKGTNFAQVARAVREYRERFPDKAVIYSANGTRENGLAALMGGGSLPALSGAKYKEALTAATRMKPVDLPGHPDGIWALGDPDTGYLVYSASGSFDGVRLTGDFHRQEIDAHLSWFKK